MKEEIINQNETNFERYTGIPTWLFWENVAVLIPAKKEKEERGGRKTKLNCWQMMLMTLEYWREYRTYFHLGMSYGISESNCYKIIKWVENVLIKCEDNHLPGKKALLTDDTVKTALVDVTESPIERPKKKQKKYYSGKKKKHTLKTQVVTNSLGRGIICTAFGRGKTHDFSLFKTSKPRINPNICVMTDSAYTGILNIHSNSLLPVKKSKNHPLSAEDKLFNRTVSRLRVYNENAIRSVKIFKIIAERYRNRRKRFALRFNLIAALSNRASGF